jgi:hypothetical protein
MNDMNLAFVQKESVYDHLRPRRNLLATCVGFCLQASHAGKKERLPFLNQEAHKICVKKRRLTG